MKNRRSDQAGAFRLPCLICCALILLASAVEPAQAQENPELNKVFAQMEKVGKGFRSFTAKIAKKKYTAILKEFDETETGEFCYGRAADGSALIREDITAPVRRILTIKGELATVFWPNSRQAKILNLGKNKDKAEYLAIGIGQSPAKLRENYDITYQGTESVDGAPCSVLLLRPKDKRTAAIYSLITMWVEKSSGITSQYKLQEPNNDYLLVNFTDEKLNARIPDSKFEQKIPNGVEIQRF
ncbi:MAG: outer membrane lipoprotein carrier protein LolA [Acidobacteria bacterium]|nr:outer membrane lipoprotein carrier protein LolA [Acidobacteriota bacterium]